MVLAGKNILLISPEPWDHIFVSKHHYAVHLGAKGNNVYFLNPPSNRTSVSSTDFDNVKSVNYRGFPKGMRFFPKYFCQYFIRQRFDQLQKKCKTNFEIVWSFDNSIFFDFSALPKSILKISHVVDLNQNFQFKRACQTANFNLTNTRFVLNMQLAMNRSSFFINHGFALYDKERNDSNFEISDTKIKIGYAGNLDSFYLNWNLLEQIITNHGSDCQFYFMGSLKNKKRLEWLNTQPGITYLGALSSKDVHQLYKQMDILLICYQADRFPEQLANPHKMMEYLGSGKVVVATRTSEYKDLAEQRLIEMSNADSDFPVLFQRVVESINEWNSEERRIKRIDFAFDNQYPKQIERIEKIIAQEFEF